MAATIYSITVLAAFALLAGAIALWRRGDRRRAGLMAGAALVILANVAIWNVPGPAAAPAVAPPA